MAEKPKSSPEKKQLKDLAPEEKEQLGIDMAILQQTATDLLRWRDMVRTNGYQDYRKGVPRNLKLESETEKNTDEIHKAGLNAFEDMLEHIAKLNKSPETKRAGLVNWGSEYILRKYFRPTPPPEKPLLLIDMLKNEFPAEQNLEKWIVEKYNIEETEVTKLLTKARLEQLKPEIKEE